MEAQNINNGKLWNFNYIYLLCLSALTATAFQMVSPIVSKYAVSLGAGLTFAGTIAGIFSITALVVRPFSGAVADRFNKKWIMVCATLVISLSVLCYTFAINTGMLLIFRIIHGVAFALSGTTNMALASSFIPENKMGEGIGYLGLGQILSTAVGPSLGLWVVENLGYNWCFGMSFVLASIAAVLMVFIQYKPEAPSQVREKTNLRLRPGDFIAVKLLPYAAFGGVFSLANGLISSFISMLGDERGITNVGIFFTINAVVLLIIRPFSGKLNDRKGLTFVLVPAYIAAAAAMAVLAGATSTMMVVIAGILKAIGQGSGQPALQAECLRLMPEKRGVATSTYYIGADIGQGLGPIIGGAVSTRLGFGAMYAGSAGLMILTMGLYLIYTRHIKRKQKTTQKD